MAIAGGGVPARGVKLENGHLVWIGLPCNKPREIVESDMSKAADFLFENEGKSIQVDQSDLKTWELMSIVRERTDGDGQEAV